MFMRILHAHKYFHSRDGGSRYERGLMRLQEEAGHTVAPFAMHDPRNEPSAWSGYFVSNEDTRKVSFGFGAFRQAARAFWSREAAKKFDALVDVFRPDIIHVHNIYTQISPSILAVAKRRGIPVVMTVHDYALVSANYSLWDGKKSMDLNRLGVLATARTKYIKGSFLATLVLEMILKVHHTLGCYDGAISAYTTYSSFVKNVMVQNGFDAKKISVVESFAEPLIEARGARREAQVSSRSDARRTTHDEPFVLFAGRLESYKGVHVLLEAMKYLPKHARVVIAGVGPEERALKAMVHGDPRVEFLGFVPGDALWKLMGEARMLVVPSIWAEPYGLVALEAMCQGTPIIVAKSGGLPEIVGNSEGGIVVPPADPRALARAIARLLEDDVLENRMGEAAYARAREIGDPAAHLKRIFEVYAQAIEKIV